jgi:hypothetical protein
MNVALKNRDFTSMAQQPGARLEVTQMQWTSRGGPSVAELLGWGSPQDLGMLAGLLRCPVDIYDNRGQWCWGGYVESVTIPCGKFSLRWGLADLRNSVKVSYSLTNTTTTGSTAATTAASVNQDSINNYGTREYTGSGGEMSAAAAVGMRDTILAEYGKPRGQVSAGASASGAANITLRGWFDTLDWRYCSWAALATVFYAPVGGAVDQKLGDAGANTKLLQQFTISGAAVNCLDVRFYGRKNGSPADNLQVGIYALDGSGNPTGSALLSGNAAGGTLSTSNSWITISFTAANLTAGQYGLQLSRSGAVDAANYYVWQVNTALGYTGGAFKINNGSTWGARAPDADALFAVDVDNNVDSARQIYELASTYGQFFSGVTVEPSTLTGQKLPSYRDGSLESFSEVVRMMDVGGPNGRRLLARVDKNRQLIVWEEPANDQIDWTVDKDLVIRARNGTVLDPGWGGQAIGAWCQLSSVMAIRTDTSLLMDASRQFIDGGTWYADSGNQNGPGRFVPTFRSVEQENIFGV